MKKRYFRFEMCAGLLLVCIFAVFVFFSLASGARVYKDVESVMEEQYTSRTAMSYLSMKVRQGDVGGAISTGVFGDSDALIIHEEGYDQDYVTYVYCWNGYLTELFCAASETLQPSDGTPVIAALSLRLGVSDGLLRMECETDGGAEVRYAAVSSYRGGEE